MLTLGTVVENEGKQAENAKVSWQILDAAGKTVATAEAAGAIDRRGWLRELYRDSASWPIRRCGRSMRRISTTAIVTVESGGKTRDAERVSFGVRTAVFDADKGFFLNGKSLKIQGTCNHQDHAGVGAALPDRLQYFRLGVLKEMGGNAVRTSHNMPTPEWVEGCDRMGLMMMCETRQMSSSPEGLAQLEVDGEALSQLAVDHSLVHRQRGVAVCRTRWPNRAKRLPTTHGAPLPRTRPYARGLGGSQRRQREGRLRCLRHHWLQLQSGSPDAIITKSIPSGPSTALRLPAPSPRAACTPPTRCAIP